MVKAKVKRVKLITLCHMKPENDFKPSLEVPQDVFGSSLSLRNRVFCSGMLLNLHHRNSKIFFHPAKFDNFKDEKISAFKTVSVSQSKNLLDLKLVV